MSSIGYNTAGQVEGLALCNGVADDYNYSADKLQMTSQAASKGGNTLLSLSYGYQAAILLRLATCHCNLSHEWRGWLSDTSQ